MLSPKLFGIILETVDNSNIEVITSECEKLKPHIAILDYDKVLSQKVLNVAAYGAMVDKENEEMRRNSLVEQTVYRLCPSKKSKKLEEFQSISPEQNKIIVFSFEESVLTNLDTTSLFGTQKVHILGDLSMLENDIESPRKVEHAMKFYDIDEIECSLKPLSLLVSSRIAARDI